MSKPGRGLSGVRDVEITPPSPPSQSSSIVKRENWGWENFDFDHHFHNRKPLERSRLNKYRKTFLWFLLKMYALPDELFLFFLIVIIMILYTLMRSYEKVHPIGLFEQKIKWSSFKSLSI